MLPTSSNTHENWFGGDVEIDGFDWFVEVLVSKDGGDFVHMDSDAVFCPLPTVTSTTHVDPPPTVEPPPELPRTGIEAGWVAVFGVLVLLAGIGLVAFSKKEGWQL